MVALLFVLVALGSLANSVEVRDHDNQLHKVSASLRRILTVPRHVTAASGSSARSNFVGEEVMLPLATNDNEDTFGNEDTFDRLDFGGEEGMLPLGHRPKFTNDNEDTFDRLDLVGEGGMLSAGFRPNGFDLEADDVNVDAFDDLGNVWADFVAAQDPNFDFGFPGMHYDWILLRSDVECGNNENEVNLGTFDSVDACAEACRNRDGCTNFIYGKGGKAGRCWDEAITESACTIWEDDQYDFYKLPGTGDVGNSGVDCSCVGGNGYGNECTSEDHNTFWCYLKNGLGAATCPGAVLSSSGDKYWSEQLCDGPVVNLPGF